MPLYVFLTAYLVTTVLGNVLYETPIGRHWPAIVITDFDWRQFETNFGVGYWSLLLVPFVVVPAIALLTRYIASPLVRRTAWVIPDIATPIYLIFTSALFGIVIYKLGAASALKQFLSTSSSADAAVEARFAIRDALGTWPRIAVSSLLIFLSVYSGVRSSRDGGYWTVILAFNTIALTGCLLLLSMKWPLVLFYITMALQYFVVDKTGGSIAKALAILLAAALSYILIAVILMRLAPTDVEAVSRPTSSAPSRSNTAAETIRAALDYSPRLAMGIVNRMAMPVPFYWDYFSRNPKSCGTLFDSVFTRNPNLCQPSTLIYARMYPHDGFAGRGTAPAAFHIYEYARAGWAGTALALALGGVLIGFFLTLWPVADRNPVVLSAFIMGGPTAYHMSQIPLEGVVFYDNGLWWGLSIVAWITAFWLYKMFRSPPHDTTAQSPTI